MSEEIFRWALENVVGGGDPDDEITHHYGFAQTTFLHHGILFCFQLYDDLNLYYRRLVTLNLAQVAATANILPTPWNLSVGYILFSNTVQYLSSDEFAIDLFFNKPDFTAFERERVFIKRQLFEYLANIDLLQEQNIIFQHALPVRQIFYQAANERDGVASVAVCLDSAILLPQLNPVELNEYLRWNTEHAGLITVSVLGNSAEFLSYFLFYPSTEDQSILDFQRGSLYNKNKNGVTIKDVCAFIEKLEKVNFITQNAAGFARRINPEEFDTTLRINSVLNDVWFQI